MTSHCSGRCDGHHKMVDFISLQFLSPMRWVSHEGDFCERRRNNRPPSCQGAWPPLFAVAGRVGPSNSAKCKCACRGRESIRKTYGRRLYRERNLIERFFSKLKHFRRVATRYDKLAANFLAMVQLASMRLWMRANEPTG